MRFVSFGAAFDLYAYNKRNGHFATALKPYSEFHRWGIGVENRQKTKELTFKTLKQTMEDLGHTGRTIDIFVSGDFEQLLCDVFA